jgi:hypothetical protein
MQDVDNGKTDKLIVGSAVSCQFVLFRATWVEVRGVKSSTGLEVPPDPFFPSELPSVKLLWHVLIGQLKISGV